MTRDNLLLRLALLGPEVTNIIGFHALLDDGCAKTPLDAALHQVHLNAAAVKLATQIQRILEEVVDG